MNSYKMASREACLLSWSDTIFVFQVILSKPPSSPLLWRGNISVFQGCMPFQHPWEEQKITSAPACKINRHMRDHGELFPNNTLSRSFCLYISGWNYSIWPPLAAREAMKLGICGWAHCCSNEIVVLLVREGKRGTELSNNGARGLPQCAQHLAPTAHNIFYDTLIIEPARNNLYNLDIKTPSQLPFYNFQISHW